VSGYVKAFFAWVGAGREWVWPRVDFMVWTKCAIGVGICQWPEGVLLVVFHVLGASKF
jgi:hypothetical protein